MITILRLFCVTIFCILFSCSPGYSIHQSNDENIIGRWALTVQMNNAELPSWLEIYKSGGATLVGRFVYAFGSARPIAEVKEKNGLYSFQIPRQWEPEGVDMTFNFSIENDVLSGKMIYTDGKEYEWSGTRAAQLAYNDNPQWGDPIQLFNKNNLDGWAVKENSQWKVEDGILINQKSGSNLISNQKFTDFKLHVEFKYPKGSNSGIYLRGRYEVQIEDNQGMEPSPTLFGGVYGFLSPNEMVAKAPDEWQYYDITLIGRRVTIVANGKSIITDQIIPGITGGALDSKEGEPGPIFIQGDHGPIEFRSVEITPIK